ncbi:MAG TPA: ATP-binding cassette domain-containing protein, partial [Chloroflexota bacterium]|nr:ATP-binding cassette domain-containing protein [Chloroflexota bacterium]
IARTFQLVKPFQAMTVLENVAVGAFFGSGGLRRSRAQALDKAHQVLRQTGLEYKSGYRADALTVPDRKRLEVAKALAMDPELLLLDEVMAGLNPSEVDEAMALIQDVNRQGVTIVAIEHVMKAIMGISQRIIVMDHGQQIASGSPSEIAADPEVISAYLGKRYAARASGNKGT